MNNKNLEAGAYRLTDPNNPEVDLIVLVTGTAPFLRLDIVWDNVKCKVRMDSIRGIEPKGLTWTKL